MKFESSSNVLSIAELKETLEIDKKVYESKYISDLDQMLNRFNKNNECCTIVKEKERIVGYIAYYPISKEAQDKLYAGGMETDVDLSAEDILTYLDRNLTIYIISIVVDPEYQGSSVVKELMKGFKTHIKELKDRNADIHNIVALAVSEKGYITLKKSGFRVIKEEENSDKLLTISLNDFLNED